MKNNLFKNDVLFWYKRIKLFKNRTLAQKPNFCPKKSIKSEKYENQKNPKICWKFVEKSVENLSKNRQKIRFKNVHFKTKRYGPTGRWGLNERLFFWLNNRVKNYDFFWYYKIDLQFRVSWPSRNDITSIINTIRKMTWNFGSWNL